MVPMQGLAVQTVFARLLMKANKEGLDRWVRL
jgi:hypothetical protein